MAIWIHDNKAVCIHPQGPQLSGIQSIRTSFEQIMKNSPHFQVTVELLEEFTDSNIAIHYVNEHIKLSDSGTDEFVIRATNVYQNTEDGWRMVLHHASADVSKQSRENSRSKETPNVTLH